MEYLDDENQHPDITLKVILVGKDLTGKSLFCKRIGLNYSQFQQLQLQNNPTIGFEFFKKPVKFLNKIFMFLIWDTCGQEIYQSLLRSFYRKTNIFLIFYDSFDRKSFEMAKSYFKNIIAESNTELNPMYILVRSKYENILNTKEKIDIVSDEEALEYADENNMYYFHIAINEKYETGINELFEFVLKEYIKRNNR